MRIFFPRTAIEVEAYLAKCDAGSVIIPLLPRAALALKKARYANARLPVEYLSRKQRNDIYHGALQLLTTWQTSLQMMPNSDARVFDAVSRQMLGFFQDVLCLEAAHQIICDHYRPAAVVVPGLPAVPSLDATIHTGTSDTVIAATIAAYEQRGIEVSLQVVEQASAVKKIPDAESSQLGRVTLADLDNSKRYVMGIGSDYDLFIIWEYLARIAPALKAEPLLLNIAQTRPLQTVRSGSYDDSALRYLFLGEIATCASRAAYQEEASELRTVWEGSIATTAPLAFCCSKHFRYQFDHLWNSLVPDALDALARGDQFFSQYTVSFFCDDYASGVKNRAWMSAAQSNGALAASTPHGAVNLVEFHQSVADITLVWGALGKQVLCQGRVAEADRVLVTGNPAMESLSIKQTAPITILFATSGFLHQGWSDMDTESFSQTWESALEWMARRADLQFVIKPHPSSRDLADWYREVVSAKSLKNVSLREDCKIETLLPNAAVLVLFGKPSTAGFIAARSGVPTLYLDTMLCRDVIGYSIWDDNYGIPRVTSVSKLAEFVDVILKDHNKRRDVIALNQQFAESYCIPFDDQAVVSAYREHQNLRCEKG